MSGDLMQTPEIGPRSITRGTLARNVALNLVGQGAPLIAALITIPLLIAALGTERFGVLMMAWLVIGYFSLFDLGLGRALTNLVAERLATGKYHEIAPLVATALVVMTALGCVVGLLFALVTPWLVSDVLNIGRELRRETTTAFYMLAVAVPFVVVAAGLQGVLAAFQRFRLVNPVWLPMRFGMVTGPL